MNTKQTLLTLVIIGGALSADAAEATATNSTSHALSFSQPTPDWHKLRSEHPGMYEAPVVPTPAPGQLFSVDQTTGEVVGYLFDSLRCIATGRGKREGNREIMEWQWATGHKSTRITERLSEDRMRVIQHTLMPDGGVMEEKGESVRRKRDQ